MPAIDSCEPQVINALIKDGWRITSQPARIPLPTRRNLYADFQASRIDKEEEIIIVEVKCFPDSTTQREEYYRALGQYTVYYNALSLRKKQDLIYLAIPENIYAELVKNSIIIETGVGIPVRYILCDLEREEVVRWIK